MSADTDFQIVAYLQTSLAVSDDQIAALGRNAAADFARKTGFIPTMTTLLETGYATVILRAPFDTDGATDDFTSAFADRVAADFERKTGFAPEAVFYTHDNVLPRITAITPDTGDAAGGDSVTITGTDLGTTTSVLFADVAATNVVAVSPTSVTCTTPANFAGAAYVSLTTAYASNDPTGDNSVFTYA